MRLLSTTTVTLFQFLFLHFSMKLQAYTPVEHFTISCGTTGNSSNGERTWMGDENTKFLSRPDGTVPAKPKTQSPSANQVPYNTARLSSSQFNYSFPVTLGPKFLRLFFHPVDYPSFSRNDAYFTVQSNQFTLLDGFNPSLNADAENKDTIFKEYVVYVDHGERLNLSFTPSYPNSYAFINGVEVLSMPTNLYYMPAQNEVGFTFDTSFTLETKYRINVGGPRISPRNDTGLFRVWAGHDEDYLTTQNLKDNLSGDVDGKMNITVNPDYVAPKELYETARVLGSNVTLNKSLNLTWEFPVDSNFIYMVRLHFCELNPYITDIDERMFIYVGNKLGHHHPDAMTWSHKHKGLAIYKDYRVLLPRNDAQINLLIQNFPYESPNDTSYSNPFLNGIEIIKINHPQRIIVSEEKSNNKDGILILQVVGGLVSGIIFASYFVIVIFMWAISDPISFSEIESTNKYNFWQPPDLCRRFSLVEIKAATNNFEETFIVGVGGFGHVYKGYIDDNSTPVAIKRLKPGSKQGVHEFMNEIEMLFQLRHHHLVTLVGYCYDNTEMIIVYDFMAHGNLRDHLYNTDNPPLSWKQRLQICIDAARGLHYLHTGTKHTIIHRDVKTTNILLDDKWVAKVSDFGLSSIGSIGMSGTHISTVVKGSFGYLDPENYNRQRFTEKSDVYSFGVVLFEILCARPPLIHTAEMQQVSLANWVRYCYQSGTMTQIVDPTLKGSIAPNCLRKFCEIGMSCLSEGGAQRPSMSDVISDLEFVLQLQENA